MAETLPRTRGWQFEPKWDGFRCVAFRAGEAVELVAKSGKTIARYFPDVVECLRQLPVESFVVDGELAIPVGDTISFDALQLRLHPAESRVRQLAAEQPAIFILFDMLMTPDGESMLDKPLRKRRAALEAFHAATGSGWLRLSPFTLDRIEAQRWLDGSGGALDGVVAKRLNGPYEAGLRAMIKVKCRRTADCVVGGFRYGTGSRQVGSLLLGLYNDYGRLDHVGFTATIADKERAALTGKLEALRSPPGFTGKSPGGPSRWSTQRSADWEPLKPRLVVEVRYDQVTGDRFRHGTKLMRWRPDKAPEQCTFEQLREEARPGKLIRTVVRG